MALLALALAKEPYVIVHSDEDDALATPTGRQQLLRAIETNRTLNALSLSVTLARAIGARPLQRAFAASPAPLVSLALRGDGAASYRSSLKLLKHLLECNTVLQDVALINIGGTPSKSALAQLAAWITNHGPNRLGPLRRVRIEDERVMDLAPYEAIKIFLLGPVGAGKTSLRRALLAQHRDLTAEQERRHGHHRARHWWALPWLSARQIKREHRRVYPEEMQRWSNEGTDTVIDSNVSVGLQIMHLIELGGCSTLDHAWMFHLQCNHSLLIICTDPTMDDDFESQTDLYLRLLHLRYGTLSNSREFCPRRGGLFTTDERQQQPRKLGGDDTQDSTTFEKVPICARILLVFTHRDLVSTHTERITLEERMANYVRTRQKTFSSFFEIQPTYMWLDTARGPKSTGMLNFVDLVITIVKNIDVPLSNSWSASKSPIDAPFNASPSETFLDCNELEHAMTQLTLPGQPLLFTRPEIRDRLRSALTHVDIDQTIHRAIDGGLLVLCTDASSNEGQSVLLCADLGRAVRAVDLLCSGGRVKPNKPVNYSSINPVIWTTSEAIQMLKQELDLSVRDTLRLLCYLVNRDLCVHFSCSDTDMCDGDSYSAAVIQGNSLDDRWLFAYGLGHVILDDCTRGQSWRYRRNRGSGSSSGSDHSLMAESDLAVANESVCQMAEAFAVWDVDEANVFHGRRLVVPEYHEYAMLPQALVLQIFCRLMTRMGPSRRILRHAYWRSGFVLRVADEHGSLIGVVGTYVRNTDITGEESTRLRIMDIFCRTISIRGASRLLTIVFGFLRLVRNQHWPSLLLRTEDLPESIVRDWLTPNGVTPEDPAHPIVGETFAALLSRPDANVLYERLPDLFSPSSEHSILTIQWQSSALSPSLLASFVVNDYKGRNLPMTATGAFLLSMCPSIDSHPFDGRWLRTMAYNDELGCFQCVRTDLWPDVLYFVRVFFADGLLFLPLRVWNSHMDVPVDPRQHGLPPGDPMMAMLPHDRLLDETAEQIREYLQIDIKRIVELAHTELEQQLTADRERIDILHRCHDGVRLALAAYEINNSKAVTQMLWTSSPHLTCTQPVWTHVPLGSTDDESSTTTNAATTSTTTTASGGKKGPMYLHFMRGNEIFLAVRGTVPSTIVDVLHDLDVKKSTLPDLPGVAHRGFVSYAKVILRHLHTVLARHDNGQLEPDTLERPIHLCGHSLGGAIAQLLAVMIKTQWGWRGRIHVTTIGAPAVGNAVFGDAAMQLVPQTHNFINLDDFVPQMLTSPLIRRILRSPFVLYGHIYVLGHLFHALTVSPDTKNRDPILRMLQTGVLRHLINMQGHYARTYISAYERWLLIFENTIST